MNEVASSSRAYSRRTMLKIMGGGGLSLGLAACGVATSQSPGTKSTGTSGVHIPKSGAKLPTGKATLTWMDSDDLKGPFEEAVFKAYQKAHPNITISYDGTTNERINQVVPLGIRNGSAPDVFTIPSSVPTQVAVNEGWVTPIEDVIPDFNKWKSAFPPNAFLAGVNVFNGKVYSFPLGSNANSYGQLLMYNQQHMNQASLDPTKKTFTWNEFRAACKKITQQGNGQYYGLMDGNDKLGTLALAFATLAGAPEFNWRTGQYNYTSPQLQAAIELLLAVKSDGSFFPGLMSINHAQARAQMPQGAGGMIFDGPWDILDWPKQDPSFKFGVAMTPIPNSGKWVPAGYQDTGSNHPFLNAKSSVKEVAGDIFHYMGTRDGQTNMVILSEGNLPSMISDVTDQAMQSKGVNPQARAAVALIAKMRRALPIVQVRNPATAQVILFEKAVKPSLDDVAQGVFTGQLTDIKGALKDLQDRTEANVDQAIKKAQQAGAEVSQNDWVFPNWDQSKDYTEQDYKQIKGS